MGIGWQLAAEDPLDPIMIPPRANKLFMGYKFLDLLVKRGKLVKMNNKRVKMRKI